ncbi:MAG: beta-hydroxylase [Cellvibrionaceae bacterium]|jgi:beta-hydroxylase
MKIIFLMLATYIGSILFIRLRNKANFKWKRQLSDFSTFMVPFNIPAYLLSKVPTTAKISTDSFPELKIIEDNWQVIREEALQLYEKGFIDIKADDLPGSSFYKDNRWTSFYLKIYGNKIPSAYQLAPKTMALIEQVPTMRMALFACLNPGKKLNNHHDPFAFTLRYSLGLSTPNREDCGLMVNGQHYPWRDGESILFDETYLHSAYNDSDEPRIILMTDIDRPLYSKFVQKAYYAFGWFFNRLFSVDNLDSQYTGWGNKFGKFLNAYKRLLRRFKKWNRKLYTVTKLVIIGLALYGLGLLLV